jgi:hypothetical protein
MIVSASADMVGVDQGGEEEVIGCKLVIVLGNMDRGCNLA